MNKLTKTFVAGLTALTLTTAFSAGSYAGEMRGSDRGFRDEGRHGGHGGYGRDLATGLAIGVGLALISKAIEDSRDTHPHTTGHYGDDPKGGPTTQSKPKVASCTWRLTDISVEEYDKETEDFIKGKIKKETSGWTKIAEKLTKKAKDFVTEHAGKKWALWFEIASYSVHQLKTVFITYSCIDNNDFKTVDATKIVALDDTENMHWWGGNTWSTDEQKRSVQRHLPRAAPVVAAK